MGTPLQLHLHHLQPAPDSQLALLTHRQGTHDSRAQNGAWTSGKGTPQTPATISPYPGTPPCCREKGGWISPCCASSVLITGYTELLGSGRACPRVTLQCLLWGAPRVLHLMVLQVLPVLTTLLTTPLLNSTWNSCQHHPDALGHLGHTWTKGKGQPHPSQSSLSSLHPIPVVGQLRATPETETGLSARLQCRL